MLCVRCRCCLLIRGHTLQAWGTLESQASPALLAPPEATAPMGLEDLLVHPAHRVPLEHLGLLGRMVPRATLELWGLQELPALQARMGPQALQGPQVCLLQLGLTFCHILQIWLAPKRICMHVGAPGIGAPGTPGPPRSTWSGRHTGITRPAWNPWRSRHGWHSRQGTYPPAATLHFAFAQPIKGQSVQNQAPRPIKLLSWSERHVCSSGSPGAPGTAGPPGPPGKTLADFCVKETT